MAYYADLVPLVQLLEDIIYHDRYQNFFLHKQHIASIYEKFSHLHKLLDDYSPKDREAADILERRIRNVVYQARDIIETQISNEVYGKDNAHRVERVLRCFISPLPKAIILCLFPLFFVLLPNLGKEYQDLEKLKEEVDSIVEELMRIQKSHTTEDLRPNYYSAYAGTSNQASSPRNTTMGFEECLITIKDQLCGEPSKLRVVSIVGMGGIGKTTLARNIFDDGLIAHRFDCRAWTTISQDYHMQKVFLDILDSMNVTTNKSCEVKELGEKIHKHLKGRRYIVIMDDMWDTKVWDHVKRFLPNDSNGSRIVITTRISEVALYADRFGFYHQMQFLNEDQSWNLFHAKVLCPPELGDIGRLIANNCHGLPLAIVVVAGLLSKVNKTRCDWEEIARNVSLAAVENDERFSKILSLSYNHLPHHLKACLLYIGCFPEDYKIHVSKLLKLWIAEGFLKPTESKSLEAVAEECLEDLVNRNLVLITKKRSDGKIKRCTIHDLLRDLCTEIISYENFFHVLHPDYYFEPTTARNVRRLYIKGDFSSQSQFTEIEEFGSCVRSIISHTNGWEFLFFGSGYKLLRVLDADATKGCALFGFPAKILELSHLTFLAINEQILPIPPSISLLQNLQTLIIKSDSRGAIRFWSLPSQIQEMPNLRHIMSSSDLHFECQFFDERIVGEPSILKNLKTLSRVYDVRFTNQVIKMIPNIQKLKVSWNEDATEWQKFHLDNLFQLRQLETLDINFLNALRRETIPLPQSFAFLLTLKRLSLTCCKISWKDMTVVGSLPNLEVLKLRDGAFVGEKWELIEGQFPQLKYLLMEGLGLKYWQAENTHFLKLQHIKISHCDKLQEIPSEIGEIPTLQLVEVNFSELAAKSAMKMQEEQRDMGNDALQVRVYPQYWNSREESNSNEEIQEEASES